MIFPDTSVIYAMADQEDPLRERAKGHFQAILTHDYVLVEAMALIQSRLRFAAALKLARDCQWTNRLSESSGSTRRWRQPGFRRE